MLSFLADLISGLLGFLNSFLPDSPFRDFLTSTESLQLGLGWLNWFVPIGQMLTFFALYLGLLVVWVGVRIAIGKTTQIAGDLL